MTTSSPKNTNKLYKSGLTHITDEDVRKEYNLPEHLVGEELDKAAEAEQQRRNEEWRKANPDKVR